MVFLIWLYAKFQNSMYLKNTLRILEYSDKENIANEFVDDEILAKKQTLHIRGTIFRFVHPISILEETK